MKKSYHLKTSTLYFLTAENPKELFGKLYPRRIEATEYRLMEMECEDYQEVIGEYDDDHNYWEIIDEVNEGVEFDGHWLAGFEAVSSMFELAGYEQVDISEEGYEEFDDIDISKLELEKIRANVVNNQLLKDAVQEWLDNPASSEKKYGHISNWDTSKVTSMEELFSKAEAFNQPLDNWDVSNVTNMSAMFAETKLFNQPLDKWDVSNVIYMEDMFYKALAFSQDTSSWGTNEPNNENTGFTLENPHIHSSWKKRSARSKMEAGNYNEALKEILESIEIISNSINNDTAAMIYFHMQNFEKGLEYSNESIKMNGTYSLNFYNRAQILVKLDKKDLAIKDLNKAIDLDGFEDAKKLLEQIT